MSARADSLQAHPYAQTTQRKPLRSKFIICSAAAPRQENFEEETMQSSKSLDQQILEKFALLTEENQMQIIAALTLMLSGGAA